MPDRPVKPGTQTATADYRWVIGGFGICPPATSLGGGPVWLPECLLPPVGLQGGLYLIYQLNLPSRNLGGA